MILPLLVAACNGGSGGMGRSSAPFGSTSVFEREVHEAINGYRDSIGLSRLAWSDDIATIARSHSANMADGDVGFGHGGADDRVEQVSEILEWQSISENVAYSSARPDLADFFLRRWLESSQHRKNIVGTFTTTGIGAALNENGDVYVTQIFVLTD
jgi:uncharacterized protein YkwD